MYAPPRVSEIQSIGVFGEEMLLWMLLLRQSPRRPPPEYVFKTANFMMDELKSSPTAQLLPVVTVEDGMFALAALLDEIAMSLPDLKPWWQQNLLQAKRFNTTSAGVELFTRLERVRRGPRAVLATYVTVLGCGFQGEYGLKGKDSHQLVELRAALAKELGVDADRDVMGGILKLYQNGRMPEQYVPKEPVWKSVWAGRLLAVLILFVGGIMFGVAFIEYLGRK
jgi:type VI secretion system protein ImpK